MSSNPFAKLFKVPVRLNLPIENRKDFAIVAISGLIGAVAHSTFLALFWYFEVYFMALLNIASVLTFVVIYFINRKTVGKSQTLILAGGVEIIIHAIFAVLILGWESNFHFYLFGAMLITFLTGKKSSLSAYLLNITCIITYIFLVVYTNYYLPFGSISETGMFFFEVLNVE